VNPTAVEPEKSGAADGTAPHAAAGPAPLSCPACGSPVASDQSWCLECGAAARTRIAKLPRWRAATIAVTVAVVLAIGGLIYAFVKLSSGNGTVTTTPTITQTVPAAAAPTPAPTTTAPPAAATPAIPAGPTGATGAATPKTAAPPTSIPTKTAPGG
jgi:hypothetical protein